MSRLKSIKERFYDKIEKSECGCWNWIATKHNRGYGYFHTSPSYSQRKMDFAHRVSVWLHTGVKPKDGEVVMHKCDNTSCVNPDHLCVGSQKDNMKDMADKGRVNPHKLRHSKEDMELAMFMREEGATMKRVAEYFNMSKSHASRFSRGMVKVYGGNR